jgi:Dockerin type I domain
LIPSTLQQLELSGRMAPAMTMQTPSGRTSHRFASLLSMLLLALVSAAPAVGQSGPLSGNIRYYSNDQPVPGAAVLLNGSAAASTSSAGQYTLSDVAPQNATVEPLKNGATAGAVSSLDAARILQVQAKLATFTDRQRLACDVTGNGTLSSLDAARIIQYLAGLIDRLPVAEACNSDWLFLPSPSGVSNGTPVGPLISNGACTRGALAYTPAAPPLADQDFVALLFGDCTGNWTPPAAPVLGTRVFSLNPTTSSLKNFPGSTTTGFTGELDLALQSVDSNTGIGIIDVTGASQFLSLDLGGGLTLCIHPEAPTTSAGVVSCNGGVDLGVHSSQDHDLGKVGVNGFTEQQCTDAGGTVEGPSDPHPGTCNGPINLALSGAVDSGPGAVLIAPDARFGVQGLAAELSVVVGPCDPNAPATPTLLALSSAVYRVDIENADDTPGNLLSHDERGEPFSCPAWTTENGPGRLVLGVGTLHGDGAQDLITDFVFDD